MKKTLKVLYYVCAALIIIWALLTLYVQYLGTGETIQIGNTNAKSSAVIIYNPDPFYNFDEQICKNFAEGLQMHNISSTITTVNRVHTEVEDKYDLYVFCTNTYNFAPDWKIIQTINNQYNLSDEKVVGITLGGGTTAKAQKRLENSIKERGAQLIGSRFYWLSRPNDDDRMEEDNVLVANEMAKAFGEEVGLLLSNDAMTVSKKY